MKAEARILKLMSIVRWQQITSWHTTADDSLIDSRLPGFLEWLRDNVRHIIDDDSREAIKRFYLIDSEQPPLELYRFLTAGRVALQAIYSKEINDDE